MKKILAILDSIEIYGKERANIQVCDLLKKNGYDVAILYNAKASEALKNEVAPFEHIPISYPRNIKSKYKYLYYIPYWFKANFLLSKYIKNISPNYILVPTEIALLYLFLPLCISKSKIVFRMGDDPIVLRFSQKLVVGVYQFIWKNIILKHVDKIVCNAVYIKNNLNISGRNLLSNDVIIYNYPPERTPQLGNQDLLMLQQFSTDKELKLGYIGRIVEEKGVFLLLESVISLLHEGYNLKLLIAGNLAYDSNYSKKLTNLVLNCNLSSQIVFLGEIKDANNFYKTIDVLCIPSIYNEPSANVVVEAKSCSCPSILFNVGGTPELITHLEDGYICSDVSEVSLKEGILYYLKNPDIHLQQGKAALESINLLGIDYKSFEKKWLTVFN